MTAKNTMYEALQAMMHKTIGGFEVVRDPHESTYPPASPGRSPLYDFKIVPMSIGAGLNVMSSRYQPNPNTPRDWEISLTFEEMWEDGCTFIVDINAGEEDPYGWIRLLRDREWIHRYETHAKRELNSNATKVLADLLLEHQASLMRTGRYY